MNVLMTMVYWKKSAEGVRMRNSKTGFTIVELVMVIVVIGILSAVVIVGYGAWRGRVNETLIKSDLANVATAMESARTFGNQYPLSLPADVVASEGVSLSLSSASATSYCVDAYLNANPTDTYHIDEIIDETGAEAGTCAARTNLPIPDVPSGFAVTSSYGSTIQLEWNAAANATGYVAQCASDAAFIIGLKETTVVTDIASVTGMALSSTFYCRVKSVNSTGSSAWTTGLIAQTTDTLGSMPVATSLEGYWDTAPEGFLIEDGSAVSRTTYAALFAVIGTSFGVGDGSSTFNLPDSRGRIAVNQSADTEFDTIGEKSGTKTEILSIAQMPSHTHTQTAHTHVQDQHVHSVTDPGHNHTQNIHSHTLGPSADSNAVGLCCGGQSGWSLAPGTNNAIYRFISTAVAASNYYSGTGISYVSTTATNVAYTAVNQNNGGGGSHNNIQPSIVKKAVIKYTVIDAAAPSLPAGTSIQGYWTSTPTDYALEDGSAYSRAGENALYTAIGTIYGAGDGSTTFNVPDSRGRTGVNINSADTDFDVMNEKNGTKTETLTTAQLPSHTHTQTAHTHTQNSHTHTVSDPAHNHVQYPHGHEYRNSVNGDFNGMASGGQGGWGLTIGTNNNNIYRMTPASVTAVNSAGLTGVSVYDTVATNQNTTAINQNTGGDGSHNNIQPSIVKKSVIKKTVGANETYSSPVGSSISGYWVSGVPAGYLAEDGSEVPRSTYAALYDIIGDTYGAGNGSTTFNLPDSRGRVSVALNPTDTEFDAMGEKTGSKTEILSIAQMPSHTHIQDAHNHTQNAHGHAVYDPTHGHNSVSHNHEIRNTSNGDYAGMSGGSQGGWGVANSDNNNIYRFITGQTTATNNAAGTGISLGSTAAVNQNTTAVNQNNGSGSSHNNIQPSIVKLYAIKY